MRLRRLGAAKTKKGVSTIQRYQEGVESWNDQVDLEKPLVKNLVTLGVRKRERGSLAGNSTWKRGEIEESRSMKGD